MNRKPVKILIIQTAFLGDVVLALPLVQALKKIDNNCLIDFLCIPQTSGVLENNPFIRKAIVYDKKGKNKLDKFIDVVRKIKAGSYDVVFCLQRHFRSSLIAYLSKAKLRIGFNNSSASVLMTRKIPYQKSMHEIQRNLTLLEALPALREDEYDFDTVPKLFPDEKDNYIVTQLLGSGFKDNYISIAPCSKWFTKQITQSKAEQIIKTLFEKKLRVVLIGGYEDFNYCKQLEKSGNNDKLLNLCGRLTPLQSYLVISRSKVLITTDSAAQHLGAASETPVVLIYGSTNPSFGFYPLTSRHIIVENNTLDCRPCTNHGKQKCPLKHFKCIEDLDVNMIVDSALKLM
jgi:heptosyltransferase-2